MAFDFKKEYKAYYLPKNRPEIVTIPPMSFVAVRGQGDPNEEGGAYKAAIGVLYAVAYTIKMSKLGEHRMAGYYDFVVPPLEGFWWQEGRPGVDVTNKAAFRWISAIRLPDFVTVDELRWAAQEAGKKKGIDCSPAELLTVDESLCVQMLHVGPFDTEPGSVAQMDALLEREGYENDFDSGRFHHEIYLSDVRKVPPEKWRTVLRHPIRKKR